MPHRVPVAVLRDVGTRGQISCQWLFGAKEKCTVLATVENLFPRDPISVTRPSSLPFRTKTGTKHFADNHGNGQGLWWKPRTKTKGGHGIRTNYDLYLLHFLHRQEPSVRQTFWSTIDMKGHVCSIVAMFKCKQNLWWRGIACFQMFMLCRWAKTIACWSEDNSPWKHAETVTIDWTVLALSTNPIWFLMYSLLLYLFHWNICVGERCKKAVETVWFQLLAYSCNFLQVECIFSVCHLMFLF